MSGYHYLFGILCATVCLRNLSVTKSCDFQSYFVVVSQSYFLFIDLLSFGSLLAFCFCLSFFFCLQFSFGV